MTVYSLIQCIEWVDYTVPRVVCLSDMTVYSFYTVYRLMRQLLYHRSCIRQIKQSIRLYCVLLAVTSCVRLGRIFDYTLYCVRW